MDVNSRIKIKFGECMDTVPFDSLQSLLDIAFMRANIDTTDIDIKKIIEGSPNIELPSNPEPAVYQKWARILEQMVTQGYYNMVKQITSLGIELNPTDVTLYLKLAMDSKDIKMLQTLILLENSVIMEEINAHIFNSYKKISEHTTTANKKLVEVLGLSEEDLEKKMTVQDFKDALAKIIPLEKLEEEEVEIMYWTFFLKYKRKLRYKRFIEELEMVTKKWTALYTQFGKKHEMKFIYMFMTKDGRVFIRGEDDFDKFTYQGKLSHKQTRFNFSGRNDVVAAETLFTFWGKVQADKHSLIGKFTYPRGQNYHIEFFVLNHRQT